MDTKELLRMSQREVAEYLINNKKLQPSLPTTNSNNTWYKELTPTQIYRLTMECAKALKLNLEPEPLYYILNDAKNVGVAAIAGSGKTTSTTFRLFRQICLSGFKPQRICVMTFTKESEKDLIKKFKYIKNTCNPILKRFGIFFDDTQIPIIKTLNSLTYNIILDFPEVFGQKPKNYIVSDTVAFLKMEEVLKLYSDSLNLTVHDNLAKNLINYYNIRIESCLSYEELSKNSEIKNAGFTAQSLEIVFKSYKTKLEILNVCHQAETCEQILNMCKVNPDFENKLKNLYDYIIIDEAQDVTENVKRLLKILINDKNKSCFIGDDDQRIYAFRGSLNVRLIDLFKEFNTSEVCTLSLNRRCKEEILNFSKCILSKIPSRFPMEIRANKKGGEVNLHFYEDRNVVYNTLCKKFESINLENFKSVCIGYRNNITGFILSNLFLDKGIPYIIKDSYKPGNDFLSKALYGIFNMLNLPSNTKAIAENLFKVSCINKKPISLDKVYEIIPREKLFKYYHKETLSYKDLSNEALIDLYVDEIFKLEQKTYFYDVDYSQYFGIQPRFNIDDLQEDLKILKKLSKDIRGENIYFEPAPLKNIVEKLRPQFNKYYWFFTKKTKQFPNELEEVIIHDMTKNDETYMQYLERRENQLNEISKLANRGLGVTLSTFHSMKGLEYDEVILIDLEEGIFPSVRITEETTEAEFISLMEEELQLFYVASTRPRDKLTMYWNSKNKSIFYPIVEDYQNFLNTRDNKKSILPEENKLRLQISKVNLDEYTLNNNELSTQQQTNNTEENLSLDNLTNGILINDLEFNITEEVNLNIDNKDLNLNIDNNDLNLNIDNKDLNLNIDEDLSFNNPLDLNFNLNDDLNSSTDLNFDNSDLNLSLASDINSNIDLNLNITEDLNFNNSNTDLIFNITEDLTFNNTDLKISSNSDLTLNTDTNSTNNIISSFNSENLKQSVSVPEYSNENVYKEETETTNNSNVSGFIDVAGGEALQAIMGILFTVPED